jgi:hypothetical protein
MSPRLACASAAADEKLPTLNHVFTEKVVEAAR